MNTAFSLTNEEPIMFDNHLEAKNLFFVLYKNENEFIEKLNLILDAITENNIFDDQKIVTLCDSLKYSSIFKFLNQKTKEYVYNGKATKVYTSSTVKGLESDDIILLDLNLNCFDVEVDQNGNPVFYNANGKKNINGAGFLNPIDKRFYVAASRAKNRLFIFVSMSDEELKKAINLRYPNSLPNPDNAKRLALAMGCSGKLK